MNDHKEFTITARRRTFSGLVKSVVVATSGMFLLALVAILVKVAVFEMFAGVQGWQSWRADHYWPLLVWRMTLFGILGFGWCNIRARLMNLDKGRNRSYVRRVEILFAVMILLFELSGFAFAPQALP